MSDEIIEIITPAETIVEVVTVTEIVEVVTAGPQGSTGATGPTGPTGPAGPAGGETYTHQQMTSSAVWTITHNLGRFPSVTVIDTAGTVVIGDYEYQSNTTVILTFAAAFSGTAYLN